MSKYKDQLPLRDQVLYEFGRCVMNLQSIELLIKGLLQSSYMSGNAERVSRRNELISKSTLGGVKTELFESLLVDGADEADVDETHTERYALKFRQSFVLPSDERESYQEELSTLIEARNDLVHHFQSKHDLSCEGCCEGALLHLDDLNTRAQSIYESLESFREAQKTSLKQLSELIQSDSLLSLLTGELPPPGQDWLIVAEVQSLIEAAKFYQDSDGKTLLVRGIEHAVQRGCPDEAYKNYGCKSWQDLAAKTGLFTLERHKNPHSERWEHFYRLGRKVPL